MDNPLILTLQRLVNIISQLTEYGVHIDHNSLLESEYQESNNTAHTLPITQTKSTKLVDMSTAQDPYDARYTTIAKTSDITTYALHETRDRYQVTLIGLTLYERDEEQFISLQFTPFPTQSGDSPPLHLLTRKCKSFSIEAVGQRTGIVPFQTIKERIQMHTDSPTDMFKLVQVRGFGISIDGVFVIVSFDSSSLYTVSFVVTIEFDTKD